MTVNVVAREERAFTIAAWCRMCEEVIYRSVRPLVMGRDTLQPQDFVPAKPTFPPPSESQALCPTCGTELKFIRESEVPSPAAMVSRPTAAPIQEDDVHTSSPGALELFAAGDGEEVREMVREDGRILVLTNRRVLVLWL